MNKKYIYIFIFFVLLFLSINSVDADYKASAINPKNATCSLVKNSTGYCFYADQKLNSVNYMKYLDTGDEVTVITSHEKIKSNDTSLCPGNYVYISQLYSKNNKTYYGYYCDTYLSSGEVSNELKEEFKNAGFPESYWSKLSIMKQAHPSWVFRAVDTKLKFNDAVKGEMKLGHSLVRLNSSNNYAYLSISEYSFDYYKNKFVEHDSIGSSNPWCDANYDTIAYYLDPRNFLSDMYIFQFMGLSYDESVDDDTYKNLIKAVFKDDYLAKFVDDFLSASKESKISPIYLSSLSRQEIANGATPGTAIDGTYNKMYNFYNIGATGGERPVLRGLDYAAKDDPATLRPWNTEYKAIVGGALWMNNSYISMGQDTSYFKKWNVIYNYLKDTGKVEKPFTNFNHEYMTNVNAPSTEAVTTYRSYASNELLDSGFIFYIPVFSDMPDKTSLPEKGGWPNNYLSSISINGDNIAEFDSGVEVYNYYLDINTPKVNIEAKAISDKASIKGNGEYVIDKDTTKEIIVTAQNGNTKTYKVNIKLTGTKLEDPIDVKTTLNNAGIKNGDKYITGLDIHTDISVIKNKINNANKDAIVNLKNSSDKDKNTGIISTGDIVEVTVGSETKKYEIVLYGDANGDGEIDALDYVKIRKYIMSKATLSGPYFEASDVNKDSNVDALDYVKVRKYIMNTGTISQ